MLGFPDAYTVRARIFPALIAATPAIALIAAFVSWKEISISHGIAGMALLAILWLFSDQARRKGKELEPGLYAKMGGMPSTAMLRYRDLEFDAGTKQQMHRVLAARLNETPPSAEDEISDPAKAEAFYQRAGNWLREHTRDIKKFQHSLRRKHDIWSPSQPARA